jgi:thiol-disulfide isomerase/thioredoxin
MPIPAARLYFFYQTGCPACMSAEPQLSKFSWKHPHLMVIRRNVAKSGTIADFDPQGTPAYLLMVEGKPVWRHEGLLLEAQLQKMWGQALAGEVPDPIEDDEDDEDAYPKGRKGHEDEKDDKEDAKDEEEE